MQKYKNGYLKALFYTLISFVILSFGLMVYAFYALFVELGWITFTVVISSYVLLIILLVTFGVLAYNKIKSEISVLLKEIESKIGGIVEKINNIISKIKKLPKPVLKILEKLFK